jgi:uncharacterized membrane protein YGL010W
MGNDAVVSLFSSGMGLIVIPWCIFVTVSIFNQRQEIALLKQSVETLMSALLKEVKKLNESQR